jgi:hypothetical protein
MERALPKIINKKGTPMFTQRKPHQTATQTAKTADNGGYMAELDKWLDEVIFAPIQDAITSRDAKELHIRIAESKQLIKRKVLASYHNGLKAKSSNPKTDERPTYHRN